MTMADIDKRIVQARPSLRSILPVVFWQTVVFSVLNLALGLGIYVWKPTIFPLVAPNLGILHIWAFAFFFVGIALGHGLIFKKWERLRGLMCLALLYKLLWSIALLFRVRDGGTFLIAALFIGLAALQAVIIIYYLPPDEAVNQVPNDGKLT